MKNEDTMTITKTFTVGQLWEAVFGSDGAGIVYWSPKIRKQNGKGIDLWKTVDGELQPNPQDFKIWDIEENKWHFVTVEDLRTGFEKALKANQTHCGGYPLDLEDYDACFCDMVMQYAIFGELVYG
jgi:hypothetical protein